MIEQYIKQLKSLDSTRRREAITALSKSGDPRAIEPLMYAARTDPDPQLRQFAAYAIRQIQSPTVEPAAVKAEPAKPAAPGASPTRPLAVPQRPVNEQATKRAKEYLNRAFEHRLKGETHDAVAELAQAVRIDPNRAEDSAALALAADLTGAPPEEAVEALLARDRQWEVRRRRVQLGPDGIAFLVEIVIFFVILALVIAVFNAGLIAAVNRVLGASSPALAAYGEIGNVFRNVKAADFLTAAPIALLVLALLLFWNGITYAVGVAWGGTGLVLRVLRTLTAVQIATYVLTIIVQSILLVPIITTLQNSSVPVAQTLFWVSVALSGFCLVGAILGQSYFAGREHGIGFLKGFISVLLGTVVFTCFWAILGVFILRR